MAGKVSGLRGTTSWGCVTRVYASTVNCTHKQSVSFIKNNKYYTATFLRFHAPYGSTSYDVDVVRDCTGRYSKAVAKEMMQSGWLGTFKRNVREWAGSNCNG